MHTSLGYNYILYGNGELGKATLQKLKANGVCVIALLDKQVQGMYEDVPVFLPDAKELNSAKKADVIVIICLNAGMEHYDVAEGLYSLGFEKIVFLPMRHAVSHAEKIRLTNLYNRALSGLDVGNEVEKYCLYRKYQWNDNAIIRQEEKGKLIWIGQEILYSEDKSRWRGDISKVHTVNNGIDVNLNSYYWYHNLFDYLDGYRNECNAYFSIFNVEPNSEKAFFMIKDREKLFSLLKKEIMSGLDFFWEGAPEVIWNEKGYFNIIGGCHRTIFLQHQGYVFYPVKVSGEDYKVWENKDCLIETIAYIEKNEIRNTYVPVPHPDFVSFPYLREEWGKTILGGILQYLGSVRLKGVKVVDASQYEGYFARVAKRMCADKVTFFDNEEKIRGLAEKFFALLHVENIEVIDNIDRLRLECKKADILFGMLHTLFLLETGCLEMFSGKLFSEFYVEDDTFQEMILNNTKMNHYTVLQRKVFQGKMLEIGVFEM